MTNKTWNVRDQTEHELRFKAEKLYTNIEAKYKLLKKVSQKEDTGELIIEEMIITLGKNKEINSSILPYLTTY